MERITAILIFIDIRGFTKWAEDIDTFQFIDEFVDELYCLLSKEFVPTYMKTLGDGAMLVIEINQKISINYLIQCISSILNKINHIENTFEKLCETFSMEFGCSIDLKLGWGITRGVVKKLKDDYIGSNINKCSKLCDIARPFGVVIDKDDFPILPNENFFSSQAQIRKFESISSYVNVWVTKEIADQFIPREKLRQSPEVHISGLCIKIYANKIYALIAKRNDDRKLFPGKFEGCGGQLASNESFILGVKRHFLNELSINVSVIEEIHTFYCMHHPNEPIIPGIQYLCIYEDGEPNSKNHSEIRWISLFELKDLPKELFIHGLKEIFIDFIEQYKKIKGLK
ncbi:MAG: hypothetical protein HQ534_00565 [Armatimonadetes bacterium]|nr:hypothetical protein [Armatimonadota bacterium]